MAAGARTAPSDPRYAAFVSYSHTDEIAARWLHRRLEAYRVPAPLVGSSGKYGPIPRRIGKVFRDREEFAAGGELKEEIQAALDRSDALIVICSPRSAASSYVNEEVLHFLQRGSTARVIPVILDGEPSECFPPALRDGVERLGADFRKGKDEREGGRLKVLAGLLGVGMDEIIRRERVAQRWRLRAAVAAVVVFAGLAVAAAGFGWLAQRNAALAAENEKRALDNGKRAEDRAEAEAVQRRLAERNAAERDAKAQELRQQLAAAYLYRAQRYVERADEPAAALFFAESNLLNPSRAVRDNGLLRLQELVRPRLVIGSGGELAGVDISPDGTRVLTMDGSGKVQVWNARSGARSCTLRMGVETYMFRRAAFSRSGSFIFTAGENARLWDARTCKPLGGVIPFELRQLRGVGVTEVIPVENAALDPSEQTVVLRWQDGFVQSWSARTASPLGDLTQPANLVDLAFLWDADVRPRYSPDRKITLQGGDVLDAVQLVNVETGSPQGGPLRHTALITAVAFSPDSRSVVTAGGFDETARIWDTQTGEPRGNPLRHAGNVTVAAYAPDGQFIVTAAGETASLWNASGQLEMVMPHAGEVIGGAFSANGKRLVTATKNGVAMLWDVEDRRLLPRNVTHAAWENARMLALSPDGRFVLTSWHPQRRVTGFGVDGSVRSEPAEPGGPHLGLWDVETGVALWPETPYDERIRRVAFNPAGDRLVTIDETRSVQLWNARTGARLGSVLNLPTDDYGSQDTNHAPVIAAYFSPDGSRLLVTNTVMVRNGSFGVTFQSTAHRLDGRTGRQIGSVLAVKAQLSGATLLSSGEALLVLDGKVRAWPEGASLSKEPFVPAEGVRLTASAPDGLSLITFDASNEGRIWDLATRAQVGLAMKHDAFSGILDIGFSPDGKLILVADSNVVRLWNRATGEPVGAPFKLGFGLSFGEGAPRFAGPTRLRAPSVWGGVRETDLGWLLRDISPEQMQAEAQTLTGRRVSATGEPELIPPVAATKAGAVPASP